MNTIYPQQDPQQLFKKVLVGINEERIRQGKRRIALVCAGLAVAVYALVMAFGWMETDLAESGFMQIISLVFSDFGYIVADWRNFSIAMLESVPEVTVALFLSITCAVLFLLGRVGKVLEGVARRRMYTV